MIVEALIAALFAQSVTISSPTLEELLSTRVDGAGSMYRLEMTARQSEMRERALKSGTQAGFNAYISEAIQTFRVNGRSLDDLFDYSKLVEVYEGGTWVLPPVIDEYGRSQRVSEDGTRLDEEWLRFQVRHPARIVRQVPTWRDYLHVATFQVETVPTELAPASDEDVAIWKRAVREGWDAGRRQARIKLEQELQRLMNDYLGIVRYRELLARGMVRELYVATSFKGISTDGQTLRIGGRRVEITRPVRFQDDIAEWKPIFVRPVGVWEEKGND